MAWKFKAGNKVEAKKASCTVDELAVEINKIIQNPELSQEIATELLIKVFTEKKESLDEFKQRYSNVIKGEVIEKIIDITKSKLQADL
ncbi:hypothetical protein [Stygiolobus caldivivus]|uniref:Uncharacterized protein n=1 Tax=Stygiolobus caldivivus TaxID=2824673 RepID=A0A8D5U8V7_9CREN|nr:hypothetical protein [Stygiolobus caldivivus]BCU71033.1 hypothetical protein KN1_23300 [Stygiolobus caldivivus]